MNSLKRALAALCLLALHRLGRSTTPPAALPDLLAWLMAPWLALSTCSAGSVRRRLANTPTTRQAVRSSAGLPALRRYSITTPGFSGQW